MATSGSRTTDGSPQRLTTGRRVLGGVMSPSASFYRVGSTLIDAGSPSEVDAVLDALSDHAITHVLLTHAHEDHVGAAAALAEQGAHVLAPEPLLDVLADPPPLPNFRRWSWGEADPVHADPLGKVVETPDGRFEVIPTPGHSPQHVAFHELERSWVFSGDAYLGRRKELRFAEDLPAMIASMQRLAELEPETLLPGHGPVREDPVVRIERTIGWYEELAQDVHALREEGRTVGQIQRELLGWEGFLTLYTQGEFSKANLVRALLATPPEGFPASSMGP